MSMEDQIAAEVIRDRTTHRGAYQRPTHQRTARALRRLADRLDRRTT
jgi:hypothetical protein